MFSSTIYDVLFSHHPSLSPHFYVFFFSGLFQRKCFVHGIWYGNRFHYMLTSTHTLPHVCYVCIFLIHSLIYWYDKMIMKVIIMLLCIIRKGEKRNLYFHIAYVGRHGNIDMWKNKKKTHTFDSNDDEHILLSMCRPQSNRFGQSHFLQFNWLIER